MGKGRTELRLSDECLHGIQRIQTERGISTMTGAVEYAVANYFDAQAILERQDKLDAALAMVKKYANECRRNDFLTLSLLNQISVNMGISLAPNPHKKQWRGPALDHAQKELTEYLNAISTKNRENGKGDNVVDGETD